MLWRENIEGYLKCQMKNVFFSFLFLRKDHSPDWDNFNCVAVTFILKSCLSKWGTSRLWVDQFNLKSIFRATGCVTEDAALEKNPCVWEQGHCCSLDKHGWSILPLNWMVAPPGTIYGRGFNYWRQHSALRAVGNARALTVRGQNLWLLYIFITRRIFFSLQLLF